jgi:amino acid permease
MKTSWEVCGFLSQGAIPLYIFFRTGEGTGKGTAAQSPFVIAINRAGIRGAFCRCPPLSIWE